MNIKRQIYFWLTAFILLVVLFGRYYDSFFEAFYFVAMLFPVVVITCYFFNLILVERFLLAKKYFLFGIYSVYMLIISLYLEMVVIVLAFIFLANYSANNLSPVSTDISVLAVTLYLIVFIYSFIYLFQQNLHKNQEIDSMAEEKQKYEVGSFVVRANRENRKLNYEEVIYIESLADYVKIHITGGETVLTKEKISKLAELLPDQFLRIHRSFIVNKHAISAFNKDSISINNQQLSISRSYKDAVISQLQGLQ